MRRMLVLMLAVMLVVAAVAPAMAQGPDGDEGRRGELPPRPVVVPAGFGGEETPSIPLNLDIQFGDGVEWIEHNSDEFFGKWLGMNLPFGPAEAFWLALQDELGVELVNRGEAHITVITPPEHDFILSDYVSIETMNQIALDMNIQSADMELICLGRAQAEIEVDDAGTTSLEQTYYIVVESEDLRDIRRAIFDAYTAAGGDGSQWDPDAWYPHITIGFTVSDLFEDVHGVRKGPNSCFAELSLIEG